MFELDYHDEIGHFKFALIGFRKGGDDIIKFFQQYIWPKLNVESKGYAEPTFICDDIESNTLSVVPNNHLDLVFILADFTNNEELQRVKDILLAMQDDDKTDKYSPFVMGIDINPYNTGKDLKMAYNILSFCMDILLPLNKQDIPKNITLSEKDCISLAACQPIKMSIATTCIDGLIGFDFVDFKDILRKAGVANFIFGEAVGERAAFHATCLALDGYAGEIDLKDVKRVMLYFAGADEAISMLGIANGVVPIEKAVNEEAEIYYTAGIDDEMEDRIQFYAILIDI